MFTLKVGLTVGSLTLFLFLINKTNLLVIGVCCECTRWDLTKKFKPFHLKQLQTWFLSTRVPLSLSAWLAARDPVSRDICWSFGSMLKPKIQALPRSQIWLPWPCFKGVGIIPHLRCLWGRSSRCSSLCLCVGGKGCIFQGLSCVCLSVCLVLICKPGDKRISWDVQ